MSEAPRDSQGRLTAIHGLVLDESNPLPTLRELLRQWMEVEKKRSALPGYDISVPGDLITRTYKVLEAVGPDCDSRIV